VLCGWSYGALVILDYLRHYGEDRIGGVHFVGGVTKLGSDAAMSAEGWPPPRTGPYHAQRRPHTVLARRLRVQSAPPRVC
jgi:pimeloyl-ACP methyl ester carboxylesterase